MMTHLLLVLKFFDPLKHANHVACFINEQHGCHQRILTMNHDKGDIHFSTASFLT